MDVAVELEERMRRGMRRVLSRELILPLLMLVLGRREVLLNERLGLRGW